MSQVKLAIKTVKQNYKPTTEILILLEEFRKMVNDSIRIGLAENITSMKALSGKSYHHLAKYPVLTCYRLTAISKAAGMLRNYRKTLRKHPNAKKPYASKLMLTDCYAFRIVNGQLRLSLGNKKFVLIQLNQHTLATILSYNVKSVRLNASTLSINFSKETTETPITGLIGIDRNLDNVTTAILDGRTQRFDLSKATTTKALYREVKSHFRRNDVRVAKRIQQKYGNKQRNKVQPILHNMSKRIVEKAKAEHLGIVMENLTGIRKLYRKGNGQGKEYRARLNGWSFYEFQRQIGYKARWEGIPVIYVRAAGTSSVCAICGSLLSECTERKVYCSHCDKTVDRDENAALNIVKAGVRFAPKGVASEARKGNGNAPNEATLILRVDATQSTISQGGKNYPTKS